MAKHPTTIRLEQSLYKQVLRAAQETGMSFSAIVHVLLRAFVEGSVEIGVTQYPKRYLDMLEKESKELSRRYHKGKVKGFTSSKELFDAMLEK